MVYYLEVISTILFLLFLGIFFGPVFGGCFSVIVFLFILGVIVVFLSINFIWIIAIGLIFYFFGWAIKFYRWYKLPTLFEYFEQNPSCNLGSGILCKHCNSAHISHEGLLNQRSKYRYYMCDVCGHVLYRFKVL